PRRRPRLGPFREEADPGRAEPVRRALPRLRAAADVRDPHRGLHDRERPDDAEHEAQASRGRGAARGHARGALRRAAPAPPRGPEGAPARRSACASVTETTPARRRRANTEWRTNLRLAEE